MEATQNDNIFSFEIGNISREIVFVKSVHLSESVDSDVYSFLDDKSQILSIVKVKKGVKTLIETVESNNKIIEGFLKGKGTLTVFLQGNNKNSYYFETAGYNKEVEILNGQSVQWSAPNDSDLIYYKIRDLPTIIEPPAPPAPTQLRTIKAFLSSQPLDQGKANELTKLVNKPRGSINFALIENAADLSKGMKERVEQNRLLWETLGFDFETIDLRVYINNHVELLQKLQPKDVIWFGSGNVFYLNWLLQSTRTNEILKYLVGKGTVFGGDGAGAIVAGPTLKHFETLNDPNLVPEIGTDGLGIIDTVVIPHFENAKSKLELNELHKKLTREHRKIITLNESQVFIVNGNDEKVI
jgi:peptidase E